MSMMLVGAGLGFSGIGIPSAETGIAVSIVLLGALVASGRSWSTGFATALAGFFAIFHGYAHGAEMPSGASTLSYGAGFIVATALLHGAGILAGMVGERQRRVIRVAGGVAAGAGLIFALG